MTWSNTSTAIPPGINSSQVPTGTTEWTPPPFDASAKKILLAILLSVLDIATLLGNLLVLVAFIVDRRLLQPFNLFILNLAVTDFLIAATAMTFYTIDTLLGYWPFGFAMCYAWIYFDFAMTFASVFTLVAISIDRFWCVTWPIHYKVGNSRSRTAYILVIIWSLVVIVWTPPFIGHVLKDNEAHYCIWEPSQNLTFVAFVAVIGHYVPCIIMVSSYIKVFYTMKRSATRVMHTSHANPGHASKTQASGSRSIQTAGPSISGNTTHQQPDTSIMTTPSTISSPSTADRSSHACKYSPERQHKHASNKVFPSQASVSRLQATSQRTTHDVQSREKKIFVTLTYVLSCYLICWFPFYVTFDTFAWAPEVVPSGLYTFFFWMTYVNSALNPFIYAYTSKEFRAAFIRVLTATFTCKK